MIPRTSVPIRPGQPISQKGFGAALGGTLGCFMIDNKTGGVVLLSNQHVLGFYKPLSVSEQGGAVDVIQPDGSEIASHVIQCDSSQKLDACQREMGLPAFQSMSSLVTIHHLQDRLAAQIAEKCVVARYLRGQLKGGMDVAIAALVPGVQWANKYPDEMILKQPPPSNLPCYIWEGMEVRKWGARSGCWKTGKISKLGVTADVTFATTGQKTLPMPSLPNPLTKLKTQLTGLIEVMGDDPTGTFQMQGDSGSALCTKDGFLIGILSSGGLGRLAYAIPILDVMSEFGLSFPQSTHNVVYEGVKYPARSSQGPAKLKKE